MTAKNNNNQRVVVVVMVSLLVLALLTILLVVGRWTMSSSLGAAAAAATSNTTTSLIPFVNDESSWSRFAPKELPRWFQYSKQQEYHHHHRPYSFSSSSSSSSLHNDDDDDLTFQLPRLIVCGMDGRVQMVEARTGKRIGDGFATQRPLLTTAMSGAWHVVPSWDGFLYFIPTITTTTTTDDGGGASTDASTSGMPPLSIPHLVQHPVQTCTTTTTSTAQVDCGILTATKVTSLWAVDANTGQLKWHRAGGGNVQNHNPKRDNNNTFRWEHADNNNHMNNNNNASSSSSSSSASSPLLLLQREDYLIQQVSAETGQVQWNVSVADYQALDFPSATIITTTTTNRHHTTTTVQDDDEDWLVKDTLLLPNNNDNNHHHDHDHSPDLHSIHHAPPPPLTTVALPLISFGGEQSQSLVAFDDRDPDVMLWKLHLGQTIASVFGIDSNQQWAALQVVANVESYRQDDPHQRQESLDITTTMIRQPLLPTTASDASNADSFPPFAELTDFDSSPYYKESRHGMIPTNQAKLPTQENKSRFPRFVHRHDRSNMAQKRHARRPTDGATVSSSSSSSQQQHLPSPSNNKVGQHDGDDDDDQTTSKALVTIPNSNDPNHEQDDDYYYDYHSHYNFLQEFYNQQQQSNNIIKRRLGNNVILPQTVPLLLLPGPPPPSGLLVMSRTTALVLVLLWSMVWIIGARWWILRNKKERPTDTPAVSAATTSTASETSKDSANNKADRSLTPITGTVQLKAAAPAVSTSATLDPTTTANPPGSTASNTDRPQGETMASGETATNDGTILVDGIIPLLRYSRYKSEFRRIEHLGRGGFGSVVRCQNVLDGREYAIKKIIIDDDLDSNKKDQPFSQRLHRVLREVKSLALLDHVNVVRYYTAWLEHGAITNEEEDDDQHPARDSYYYGSGGDMASISLPKNEQKKPFGSSNVRSWRESSSTLTNAAFQRRPSGSNWSSVVKSAVVGRPNSSWRNHEESLSTSLRHSTNHAGLSSSWEDYGFTFQQSEAGEKEVNELSTVVDLPMVGNTGDGSNDDSHSTTSPLGVDGIGSRLHQKSKKISPPKPKSVERQCTPSTRHTLYIQMQLCSQKTLGDFLSNAEARRGPSRSAAPGCIDIPFALSLFHQIAQGVQHVHRQGLIHRDLKPNNCFIDEGGVVKVGDFGLSREASSSSELNEDTENMESDVGPDDEFNTAGVGTRSYASPEQMNGSDYDSSTDIYSLGIMLFEVCYPMYTGMERHIVFSKLRGLEFPGQWHRDVASSFPALHDLVKGMLSPRPRERPTADAIVQEIQSLLGEITILSLDRSKQEDGSILLRVEAAPTDGVLRRTMQLIQEAVPDVEIIEYGLRGGNLTAIMEFALGFPAHTTSSERDSSVASFVRRIVSRIESSEDTRFVRQVSSGFRVTIRES